MESAKQQHLMSPATCFTIACVAFSLLAATAIWRNQNVQDRSHTKPTRPRPSRRVAVDSLYEETAPTVEIKRDEQMDSPLATVAQLIALCARQAERLRDSGRESNHAALLSELAKTTTDLCRLQQCLCSRPDAVAPGTGTGALLIAMMSGLQASLRLINPLDHADEPSVASKRYDQAMEQLRAQKPAFDFLISNMSVNGLPPTPPNELAEAVLAKSAPRSDQTSILNVTMIDPTSTGLTPSIDAKGWIEPPPEYSPRSDQNYAAAAEKQDKKLPLSEEPSSHPEVEQGDHEEGILYQAVTADDVETIRELLMDGADPNETVGELQRTTLHQAAHLNHCTPLSLLLRHGAIMSTEDTTGDTALHLAAWAGHVEALTSLLSHGADVDWLSGRDGYSPLWCAISASHIDAARLLLKHGARVSLRSGGGLTPLHQAAVTGQSAMCELLLERGAQVNALDEDQNAPLHHAATSGSVPSVRALLQSGADVGAEQAQGLTPAHWAAHKGHTEVLGLLLDYGAPVDATAVEGATPLHLAANRGHLAAVRLLLEKGADRTFHASAWDGVDGTPADMAREKGHMKVVRALRSRR